MNNSACCVDQPISLKTRLKAWLQNDKLYIQVNDETAIVDLSSLKGNTSVPIKIDQTITFNTIPNKIENDANFTLTASSTSGLPITYTSSNINVATVNSQGIVDIVGVGTTEITASQEGNQVYNPATPVVRNLIVGAAVATFIAHWGWKDNTNIPSLAEVEALPGSGTFVSGTKVVADFTGGNSAPKYLIMVEPSSQPIKTTWCSSAVRNGSVGDSPELFRVLATTGGYRYYISNYVTDFTTTTDFNI